MTLKRPFSYTGTCVIDADRNVVAYTNEEHVAARIADALTNYVGGSFCSVCGTALTPDGVCQPCADTRRYASGGG